MSNVPGAHLTIELASTVHDMASNGFAPKVRSEAVDRSSLGPLSGELKQVTKRLVMAEGGHDVSAQTPIRTFPR